MSETPIISITNLTKSYEDTIALNRFSVEFQSGVTGLIGPNGAGKTTLIKIMLGLIFPDEGYVSILGSNLSENSLAIRRKIGVLHERPYYPKYMTVKDYLLHVIEFYGVYRDIGHLLESVSLHSVSNKKIRDLSGGMLRKLGIVQAIAGNPQIAILDEPTANLDVEGRDAVIELLGDLSRTEGMSIIVSSHILSELEKLCDNVVFIKEGELVASGGIEEIVSKHSQNRYKVVSSDPIRLAEALRLKEGFHSVYPIGSKLVVFSYSGEDIKRIWLIVEKTAEEIGVIFDGLMKSESLEDTYREVMK
jgi:ABC-2 type transport system ATP-binding protein